MRKKIRAVPEFQIVFDLLFPHIVHGVDLKIWEIFNHDAKLNEISLVTMPVIGYYGG